MNIVFSFNKKGYEANYWTKEITAASDSNFRFIPFNHGTYCDPYLYVRAQLLDNLYYERHPALLRMYADFEKILRVNDAAAVIVSCMPPYHPDYLRKISCYKVLWIADGPISAYDRDFAYLHAYDLVLYHSPAYSTDLNMAEKLRYCGARSFDFWPVQLFDQNFDVTKTDETIMLHKRDIDVIFIGALHFTKMPLMAKMKKALGKRLVMHGIGSWKRNLYYNVKYGFPGWLTPLKFEDYVGLYQRSKIGINIHNRGKFTVGNYRLLELPANGVMQISDGGEYLEKFFRVGDEIIGYDSAEELIELIDYYLDREEERKRIAVQGFQRVVRDYRIGKLFNKAGELIKIGITNKVND